MGKAKIPGLEKKIQDLEFKIIMLQGEVNERENRLEIVHRLLDSVIREIERE